MSVCILHHRIFQESKKHLNNYDSRQGFGRLNTAPVILLRTEPPTAFLFCLSRLLKSQQSETPAATKISGKEILEAIRLMDADERRELTRALFAEKICICEATNAPVGCLRDRTICDSRWRNLAPTSSLFMQRKAGCASLAQKSPDPGKCANGVQKACSRFFA